MKFRNCAVLVCLFGLVVATASAGAFPETAKRLPQPSGGGPITNDHIVASETIPVTDDAAPAKGCAAPTSVKTTVSHEVSGGASQLTLPVNPCGEYGYCTGDCSMCPPLQCWNAGYLNCPWCCCTGVACCGLL